MAINNPVRFLSTFLKSIRLRWRFGNEFRDFRLLLIQSSSAARLSLHWIDRFPCLDERTAATAFDRHYVYHTAWAARVLAETRPVRHTDIGSSLYLAGIVSAFIPIDFYDYRPADLRLTGLESRAADLLALPFRDGSIDSLSCLHVIEYIGLGRYGDPIDPDGDLKAIAELHRVLAPGGNLLFVTPVGHPKIVFNAHRIYSYRHIISAFAGLDLQEFSLIPDDPLEGGLIRNATEEMANRQEYGCGCFWFRKST